MSRKQANLLDQIPVLKPHLYLETDQQITYLIVRRKNPIEKLAIRFFKQPPIRKINLDSEGAFILSKLDGKKQVTDLEQDFNDKFGNKDGMSLARLVRFLQIVDSYGWLKWQKAN